MLAFCFRLSEHLTFSIWSPTYSYGMSLDLYYFVDLIAYVLQMTHHGHFNFKFYKK